MPTAAAAEDIELRVPPPLPEPPQPFVSVGHYGPGSVDAEDFARRLGNWGNASRLIGERWEAVAPARLVKRLPWRVPLGGGNSATLTALLSLDADRAIGPVLQRAGVSAPDLLLVGVTGDRAIVRAADCKVSLDTADREQTAPARVQQMFLRASTDLTAVGQGLLAQAAGLAEGDRAAAETAVSAALSGDWHRLIVGEGLFVAPDDGFNRWFLGRLEERRRTGAPLGRLPAAGPRRTGADVKGPVDAAQALRLQLPAHLEPISARDFLAGVPGWEEAQIVAQLDKVDLSACDLAVAERCWRVGVGLRGAVLALKRRLFRNVLPIDTTAVNASALLRELSRRRRASDSAALVAGLAQHVAARRALWEREAALLRPPLSFSAWSARVGEIMRAAARRRSGAPQRPASNGAPGEASSPPAQIPSMRALYRELTRLHVVRVARLERELEAEGLEDAALLDAIEVRLDELTAACERDAAALGAELAPPTTEAPAPR